MPCRSDHMEPTAAENETGRVMSLLAEVRGESFDHKTGTRLGYGFANRLHQATDALCKLLSETRDGKPVRNPADYSLELQIWWRDHQEADRKRAAAKKAQELTEEDRALLQNIRTWATAKGVEVEQDDAALIARLKRLMPQIYAARGEG